MSKFGIKQIVPLVIAAICALFIYTGLTKFGFWDATSGPTPAFVPTIISVVLFIICILGFITSFKDKKESKFHKEEFLVIGVFVLWLGVPVPEGLIMDLIG